MIAIPFLGSKRNYIKPIEKLVEENGYRTVYEPFGGSAVLSVNLYNDGLVDRAVINDYDHLFDIYPHYLDLKDEIMADLLKRGFEKKKVRLPEKKREYLQSLIKDVDKKYWPLLANNFVFSARGTDNLKITDFCYFFNDLTTDKQRKYLDIVSELERTSLDYADFLERYHYQYDERSLIILDPPYLNSAQKHYKNETFFGLADTIDLLENVKQTGADFVFFNMVERDTKALLGVFDFEITEMKVKHVRLNRNSEREDIMAYVRQMPEIDVLAKVA